MTTCLGKSCSFGLLCVGFCGRLSLSYSVCVLLSPFNLYSKGIKFSVMGAVRIESRHSCLKGTVV